MKALLTKQDFWDCSKKLYGFKTNYAKKRCNEAKRRARRIQKTMKLAEEMGNFKEARNTFYEQEEY